MAFGQAITIDDDAVLAAIACAAGEVGMLSAFAPDDAIGLRAERSRYLGIIFLNAAAHFGIDRIDQRRERIEELIGKRILAFEISTDGGIEFRRFAQDITPFGIFQPSIIIGQSEPMIRTRGRAAFGPRRIE